MPRAYSRSSRYSLFLLLICVAALAWSTVPALAQLEPAPPPVHVVEPPPRDWSAQQLEQRADSLRSQKLYLDAIDYYKAALEKKPKDSLLYNKMGIVELMLQRLKDAERTSIAPSRPTKITAKLITTWARFITFARSTARRSNNIVKRLSSTTIQLPSTATWGQPTLPRKSSNWP